MTIDIPTIINEEYFKKYSPIPANYNIDDIKPYFKIAEEIWVKPVIGDDLYEELIEQVINNKITQVNSTLLLHIYPYLSFAICYEALPFIAFNLSEVGITKGKSDNSDSVDTKDINFISTRFRSTLETLKLSLVEWLCLVSDNFPLLDKSICSECGCGVNNKLVNKRLQMYSTKRQCTDIS